MDSLTKQGIVISDIQQSFRGWVFRIEQTDIHTVCIQLEVMAQHPIVEQHLNEMGLSEALPFLT